MHEGNQDMGILPTNSGNNQVLWDRELATNSK